MTVDTPAPASGMPSGPEFGRSLIQRAWEAPEEVVFPRYIVDSPGLQAEDIGVLAHLLLRDPDQPSSVTALANECQQRGWKISEYAMRSIVKRLRTAGHVQQDRVYNATTGRPDWVFTVYRNPANNQTYVNTVTGETPSSGRFVGSQRIGQPDTLAPNESAGHADTLAPNVSGATRWLPTNRKPPVSAGHGRYVGSQRIGASPPHPPEEEVTTSSIHEKRHSRGAGAAPGGADTEPPVSAEQQQAAAAFLMRLPGQWAVGRLKAKNLSVELARAVQETGWDLDMSLKGWLTRKEDGKAAPRSHVVVLEYRVKNLELREAVFAAAEERAANPGGPAGIPDWCGQCNNGEKPLSLLMRTVADPDPASDRVDLCPRCHPRAARS